MDNNEKGAIVAIASDFATMKQMLSEIELKISGVHPHKQIEFYKPIKHMIFEAWQDACNPNDTFLYSPSTKSPAGEEGGEG